MSKKLDENQKTKNAIHFINTTQRMMDSEDLSQISVRKIADAAGFHNSTIYLYFKDLDELLMLASIKYFQGYAKDLSALSRKNLDPISNFISIWDLYFNTVFKNPNIFYNFFFGKRSQHLKKLLNQYYDFFPSERQIFSNEIETMYYGDNLSERSIKILYPLIDEKSLITADNIEMINDIIVSSTKYMLELKCKDLNKSSNELISELQDILRHVCGI
ncbi:MAG: TetR/AcrR family transcriptional regulator [Suipraeoptans sp.]